MTNDNDNRPWVRPDHKELSPCESSSEETQKKKRELRNDPFERRFIRDLFFFMQRNRPEQFKANFCTDCEGTL